ncbi:MAG: amino acid ABC transporter substrate-binding protein [Saprospiraceae bacterium]|nr:amino acid ABC transporter substrate-binding protein [Saprospiraceae bacterium]
MKYTFPFLLLIVLIACNPAKRAATPAPSKPVPAKPGRTPVDTLRWTTPANPKPPIGLPDKNTTKPGDKPRPSGDTYTIAYLLPFLTGQFDGTKVPDKSGLALQFYAGSQLALEEISTLGGINLNVDVYDTETSDEDFQRLYYKPRFDKAQVYIGPVRSSQVSLLAEKTRENRRILVSPESPNMDLTSRNPGFIQTNPSLRAHCAAIAKYVRKKSKAEDVVLVCKAKEADRLPFFHDANPSGKFNELIMPDAAANFDNTDLKKYLKYGRTAVFILPTWASQDFVMSFLRKLSAVKGSNRVEVYGMPQWMGYSQIDPEFLINLNVHVSSASFVNRDTEASKKFERSYFERFGTVPNDDAYNGYDVTMFTGSMLRRFGLSFPERIPRETFTGLSRKFQFAPVGVEGNVDYVENTFVYILKFDQFNYVPVE